MNRNTIHGIDLTAPGGLDALFAFNRARFGDAVMEAGAGGDGGAGGEGTGGDAGAGTGAGAAGTGEQGQNGADSGEGKPAEWDGKVESLPAEAQKMIRELRGESKDRREKLTAAEQQQQDIVRAFAKAAGIPLPDDEQQPNPDELTQKLTAAQERARDSAAELIVWRAAKDLGVDPSAVTDSRSFERAIKDLDPTDPAFEESVKTAAKTAAEQNPKLKAVMTAGQSSADFSGGSGEGAITQDKFNAMTPAEKNALFKSDPTLYRRLAG